jgi:hypothetical protein
LDLIDNKTRDSLKAAYDLLKVELASEESAVMNSVGLWEDMSDFSSTIKQQLMLRLLRAIVFAIKPLVVKATPDFLSLPEGAALLDQFPVLGRFFGEAARTGANMLEMYNNEIRNMESRDKAKFNSGKKILSKVNRIQALSKTIDFIGKLIDAEPDSNIKQKTDDIIKSYAAKPETDPKASDSKALSSADVISTMGSVSYTEKIMADSKSSNNSESTTFYGPDGKSLESAATSSNMPSYNPEDESIWESVINNGKSK